MTTRVFPDSPIVGLLAWRGPSAILWRVSALIVDAFQRRSAWSLTHVSRERLVGLPAVAHGDASTAVVDVTLAARICASVPHGRPGNIAFGESALTGSAVRHGSLNELFRAEATTASAPALTQVISADNCRGSARALTVPERVSMRGICERGDRQSAKDATRHVDKACRSHFVSMWASMMRRTSSAMEIPRRLASRFRKALCGSVNEIICFVMVKVLNCSPIQAWHQTQQQQVSVFSPSSSVDLTVTPRYRQNALRAAIPKKVTDDSPFLLWCQIILVVHSGSIPQGIHA